MLILQDITYIHPNRDLLFADLNLIINKQDKVALIGNNGIGKSTLLKIMAGNLHPFEGHVKTDASPYYVPQIFGQFNDYSIAKAIHVDIKIHALNEILNGNATDEQFALLDNDWAIEERCKEAFVQWELNGLDLNQKMDTLSGGQKTKVFLAGIMIHRPEIVLLDEPSNHLDTRSRNLLYDMIILDEPTNNLDIENIEILINAVNEYRGALIIISHDEYFLKQINAGRVITVV